MAYIRRFSRDFPEAVTVKLEQNFRSTGHILSAANAVISRDSARLGKTLFTQLGDGDKIEMLRFQDADAEARQIAAEMHARSREGVAWQEMAVLYRYNAMSRVFEEALRLARIPYILVGDVSFWQREEVKDALALLRLAENGQDRQSDEALRRVVNAPARGIGEKALETIEAEARRTGMSLFEALPAAPLARKARESACAFHAAVSSVAQRDDLTLADQISMVLDLTGYRHALRASRSEEAEGRLENLQELVTAAERFGSATELLEFAALGNAKDDEREAGGAVSMMTLHRAKGLEFPHVFLPGWEDGLFPDRERSDMAEERRLAYVALTRAMRRATVSFTDFRRGPMRPSCFAAEIPAEHRVTHWLRSPPGRAARPRTFSQGEFEAERLGAFDARFGI